MARQRYPSDEARLTTRPHVKIALDVANHPRTAAVWADLRKRGMLAELWRIAGQSFAGRRGGTVVLSAPNLASITGHAHSSNVSTVLRLCSELGYEADRNGSGVLVTVDNFSENQGYTSATRGTATRTPSASDSDSDSEADSDLGEEKNTPLEDSGCTADAAHAPPGVEGFEAEKLVNLIPAQERTRALPWLREKLPQLLAAARKDLAVKGVEDPTRKQLRTVLIDRLHAFWANEKKRPNGDARAGPRRFDESPSAAEIYEIAFGAKKS